MMRVAGKLLAVSLLPGVLLACGGGGSPGNPGGSGGADGGDGGTGGVGGVVGTGGSGGSGGFGGFGGTGGTGGTVPGAIRVDGRVLDAVGAPVAGAVVVLDADYANPQITGGDGAFVFPAAEPPYDLLLLRPPFTIDLRGLSLPDPVLRTMPGVVDQREAPLRVEVTGPIFPLPPGESIRIAARGGHPEAAPARTNAAGVFAGTFHWSGPKSFTTELVALHTATDATGAIEYLAAGVVPDVTLVDGGLEAELSIALDRTVDVAETSFFHSPGAYPNHYDARLSYLVEGARFVDPLTQPSGSLVSYPTDNPIFRVTGQAPGGSSFDGHVQPQRDGETAIHLPEAIQLANALPLPDAVGVSRTPTLVWSPLPGATSTLVVVTNDLTGFLFVLPGDANRLTIPAYGDFGVGLAADTTYSWGAWAYRGPAYSVDRVAQLISDPARPWEGPGIRVLTELTTFRTAP